MKAVEEFRERHPDLSLRRACEVLLLSRSTYYSYQKPRTFHQRGRPITHQTFNEITGTYISDEVILKEIEEILSRKFVLYGYRKTTAALKRRGYRINHKKVYRLMKERNLLVRELWKKKRPKVEKQSEEEVNAPDRKWSIDIKHGEALNGEKGYVIAVKDCFTKEILSIQVERRHTSVEVEEVLYRALAERNIKEIPVEELYVTSDNGKEIIKAMESLKGLGIKHYRITPRSPWENGEIESFFSCLEREVFRRFEIENFEEMKNLVLEYIEFYNTERIHAGIGYRTPREVYLDYLRSAQEVLSNVG